MVDNLQKQTVNSILWTSIDRFGALGIQFLVTMVLARLLEPSDFGLVGMLALFMALGTLLIDSGFSHALIQKSTVSNQDYSTVFSINVVIGFLLYCILFFLSPYISDFFHAPMLESLSKVIFLMFPINSLCVVHLAILTRELRFKTIARISILSAIISGITGISTAIYGYGVWSLIYQQLSLYLSRVFLYWFFVRWKPCTLFNRESFRTLFQFSANLLGAGVITTTFDNIYVFIVGKIYPLNITGFFNQAWQFGIMLPSLLTGVISKATYPIFCKVKDDSEKIRESCRKILNMSLFISFPSLLGIMVMANNIFIILFSVKWLPSVPLFQILCIYGAFSPIRVVHTDIIKAMGKSRLYLLLEIIQRILVVISILFCLKQGTVSLLWGRTIACSLALFLDMYLCGKVNGYILKEQIKDMSLMLLATLLMMGLAWSVNLLELQILIKLFLQILTCIISYTVLSYIFKIKYLFDLIQVIKPAFSKISV